MSLPKDPLQLRVDVVDTLVSPGPSSHNGLCNHITKCLMSWLEPVSFHFHDCVGVFSKAGVASVKVIPVLEGAQFDVCHAWLTGAALDNHRLDLSHHQQGLPGLPMGWKLGYQLTRRCIGMSRWLQWNSIVFCWPMGNVDQPPGLGTACSRVFNPSGLSHHLSQTQHSRCRAVHEALQTLSTFETGCSLAPNSKSSDAPWTDESTDIGHSANGATVNATNLVNSTDPIDNSANATEPNAADPDAADPDAADAADADILSTSNPEQGQPAVVPSCSPLPHGQGQSTAATPDPPNVQLNSDTLGAQRQLVVDQSPYSTPGMLIPDQPQGTSVYQGTQHTLGANTWSLFCSQTDWEFAHWAKLSGPSSSALTELLAIPECIQAIYGDPEFTEHLILAPEHHYTDHECKCRVYSEMHTGDWWWAVQRSLKLCQQGATVIPVIISSDKTLLTHFCRKAAYPAYLTIGNVLKEIRWKPSHHVQMLIGYLPTTKLKGLANKAAQHRALANIFHSCMHTILAPIAMSGETGVAMMSSDRIWHWCHPIFAVFIGDFPEQSLVTCTYTN
ncbi:hypothetical protein V8E53_008046 [Lactarius tabidus]